MLNKSYLTRAKLQAYIDAHPNDSQSSIALAFGVTQPTISTFIRQNNLNYRKKRQYSKPLPPKRPADTSVAGLQKSLRRYRQKKSAQTR